MSASNKRPQVGRPAKIRVIKQVNPSLAVVYDEETGKMGDLSIKGLLKTTHDGLVKNAWLLRVNPDGSGFYGNSFFGKWDIRPQIQEQYLKAIDALYKRPDQIEADELSILKGMCNRCIKKDQWDWFTTYVFLGYPDREQLKRFVERIIILRQEVLAGNHSGVIPFRDEFTWMLSSIHYFLKSDCSISDIDTTIPMAHIDPAVWERLSEDSRMNVIIAEKTASNASHFLLMHYFAILESEFRRELIRPFQNRYRRDLQNIQCVDEFEKPTHDILCGKKSFTLGAAKFLAELVSRSESFVSSSAIKLFQRYLSDRRDDFVSICYIISEAKIVSKPLLVVRNKLAHGEASPLAASKQGPQAIQELQALLFTPPAELLKRIVFFGED